MGNGVFDIHIVNTYSFCIKYSLSRQSESYKLQSHTYDSVQVKNTLRLTLRQFSGQKNYKL